MPNPILTAALDNLASRHDLTSEQTAAVLAEIMGGNASEVETSAVLIHTTGRCRHRGGDIVSPNTLITFECSTFHRDT